MEFVLGFWLAWKFEIIGAAIVLMVPFLKKHYDNNVIVATFLKQGLEVLASRMEEENPAATTNSAKTRHRKKIRKDLAKAARKANRGKK
jgi:hypothetical protein